MLQYIHTIRAKRLIEAREELTCLFLAIYELNEKKATHAYISQIEIKRPSTSAQHHYIHIFRYYLRTPYQSQIETLEEFARITTGP